MVRTSLERRGALIKVKDMDEAVMISNRIAPEHLSCRCLTSDFIADYP